MKRFALSLLPLTCLLACTATVATTPPVTIATNVKDVQVRAFNTDNVGSIYLNNRLVVQAPKFQADTGLVDITSELAAGSNTLQLQEVNTDGDWTYGFQVYVNGSLFFQSVCGNSSWPVGYVGCDNYDATLGVVYQQTLTLITP